MRGPMGRRRLGGVTTKLSRNTEHGKKEQEREEQIQCIGAGACREGVGGWGCNQAFSSTSTETQRPARRKHGKKKDGEAKEQAQAVLLPMGARDSGKNSGVGVRGQGFGSYCRRVVGG